MPETPLLSVVVPVLNESACLEPALDALFRHRGVNAACEIIVVDGGSSDTSREIAARYPCRLLQAETGRAAQMNAAAREARGDSLLFLHADSRLPEDFETAAIADADWGYFRLQLDGEAFALRVIESAINLRTRLSRVAGGDQGLFFKKSFFRSLGGYPEIPLMEDIAISKKARRETAPLIVDSALLSSSRRWRDKGVVKTVLLMWSLRFAFWVGVDPRLLHRFYYPQRG